MLWPVDVGVPTRAWAWGRTRAQPASVSRRPGVLPLHHNNRVGRIGPLAPSLTDGGREKKGRIGESHKKPMTLVDDRP